MQVAPVDPEELVPLAPLTFVIGGARSGKSTFAEALVTAHAARAGQRPVYLATAEAQDAEMAERIRRHQSRRGHLWETIEAPRVRSSVLASLPMGAPVLLDCLTLWLSNLMRAGADPESACLDLLAGLTAAPGPVVIVSNEVGQGIVPDNALARAFRDHAGHLNQQMAAAARRVILVTAGLPLVLKAE